MNRVLVFFSAFAMATLGWAAVSSQDAVFERLKSPASVCVKGDPCADAVGQAGPVVAAARSGEQVYNGACAACHNSGAAGAPKLGTLLAGPIGCLKAMKPSCVTWSKATTRCLPKDSAWIAAMLNWPMLWPI
jgi:cytochrome c2